jgi:trehalose synthase
MDEVPITPRSLEPLAQIIGEERMTRFAEALASARRRLGGATVWHVNSTTTGGGVAEMLQSVLGYPAACEVEVRRLVIEGSKPFFELTKRLHHLLHGSPGDAGPLGEEQRRLYERTLDSEASTLTDLVRPGDVVVLHDPQVVGLAPCLASLGARVLWSCHIGADNPNRETRRAWDFLLPYVTETAAQTFSRSQYRWEKLAGSTVAVIPPCIDVFATKNQPLDDAGVTAILDASGIIPTGEVSRTPKFPRQDGTRASVTHRAQTIEDEPIAGDAPIVCQVSRWDPLKDHAGLMRAFASHVRRDHGAQLVLAGPSSGSVDDDPEANGTFEELVRTQERLGADERRRVHICSLPMDDVEENAAIVNALQRRADLVVQKSLAEGFGLTVAEAMWKGRPTLGSRVGGIQDQIEPGESGLLVDPTDPADIGSAVESVLSDTAAAAKLGESGRRRVIENYLAPSYLTDQFALIRQVLAGDR